LLVEKLRQSCAVTRTSAAGAGALFTFGRGAGSVGATAPDVGCECSAAGGEVGSAAGTVVDGSRGGRGRAMKNAAITRATAPIASAGNARDALGEADGDEGTGGATVGAGDAGVSTAAGSMTAGRSIGR
jgi:hypothetical protein